MTFLFLLSFLLLVCAQQSSTNPVVGIWYWSWAGRAQPPGGTTLGIAFNGYVDPTDAISNSLPIYNALPGLKVMCLGGGTQPGAWNAINTNLVITAIRNDIFKSYGGIAFDIEAGDPGLGPLFAQALSAAKQKGFLTIVTVSHAAPFAISDAKALMTQFFSDTNIDYLSPQLYTTGEETANDYAENMGVTWADWAKAKAKILPSIVSGSMFEDARQFYRNLGVEIPGYIQWAQSGYIGSGPLPPPTPIPTSGSFPCGSGTCDYPNCCSQFGYCGSGDAYCGRNCVAGGCTTPGSNPVPTPIPVYTPTPIPIPIPRPTPTPTPTPIPTTSRPTPTPVPVPYTASTPVSISAIEKTTCTNGAMKCLSSTTYSTCANSAYGPSQPCYPGTVCKPSGMYIYCVSPTSSASEEAGTSDNETPSPSSGSPSGSSPTSSFISNDGVAGWAIAILVLCSLLIVMVLVLAVMLVRARYATI